MKTNSTTKHSIRNSIVAVAAAAVLLAPGAAFAHRNNNDSGRDNNRRSNQNSAQVSSRPAATQAQAQYQSRRGPVHQASSQRGSWSENEDNQRGGKWWGDWRYNNDHDNDPDPNSCEARQATANKQTDRLKKASQYMLGRLSWQISTQQEYATKHSLSPENFVELTATANTDKTSAQTAINVLATPSIDCSQAVESDKVVLQANKKPVLEALRVYNIDAVNVSYAVQSAK